VAVDAPTHGIPVDGEPTGLAAGAGAVWIALNEGRVLSVLEVGPEFGNLQNRIVLEERDALFSVSHSSVELTVDEGAVWALERALGQVTRIDPTTGRRRLLADGLGASSSIAVHGTAVWLGGTLGVTKLDLPTGRELESTPVEPVRESSTTSIAVGSDAVWFVGDTSAHLWRFDPLTVAIVGSVAIGPSPSAVAIAEDGAVWVADGSTTSLWRVDPETNEPETIEIGATPWGLVADFGRVWTSPGTSTE
jgi:streptogramin lyase